MSPTVGGPPADPKVEGLPERSSANAPAFSFFRRMTSRGHRTGWAPLEAALWTVALGSALILGLVFADRAAFSAREGRRLDQGLRSFTEKSERSERPEARTASTPRRPFLARLEIPAIALSALVVDGVDSQTLRRAVGRFPASSRPGEPGDVALAGHRDTDFRGLEQIVRGDRLLLQTLDGDFHYEVESIRIVEPQRVDVLAPADHPTLTLVTCYPFRYVGPAPLRYVVRAREIARPKLPTSNRASTGAPS